MVGIPKSISVVIAAAALLGCGGRYEWTGHWKGQRRLPSDGRTSASVIHTLGMVDLTLKLDGSFVLIEGGIPKEGTWSGNMTEATLTITRVMDRPLSALGPDIGKLAVPIQLGVKSPQEITFHNPNSIDGQPVTLQRESQPAP